MAPMIEFVQSYGLWIALAGIFVAMHWFGKGCCGGAHRQTPKQAGQDAAGGEVNAGRESEAAKSRAGCH
jgi:hypothetical protein